MLFSQMCEVDQSMNIRKRISNWRARIESVSADGEENAGVPCIWTSHRYSLQVNSGPVSAGFENIQLSESFLDSSLVTVSINTSSTEAPQRIIENH